MKLLTDKLYMTQFEHRVRHQVSSTPWYDTLFEFNNTSGVWIILDDFRYNTGEIKGEINETTRFEL